MTTTDPGTATDSTQALLLELLNPAHRPDPYPLYGRIRASRPLTLPQGPATIFSSYADCHALLRDPHASSDRRNSRLFATQIAKLTEERGGQAPGVFTPSFLFLDAPDHTRLRRLVSKAFTPRMVARLEPFVTGLVDDLLDAAAEHGRLEIVGDLAYPLPVAVICSMLGVPLEDEERFHAWSSLIAQSLDPVLAMTGAADEGMPARIAASNELQHYFADLIARRRSEPGDDLLSALIAAEESGDQLTEDEILSTCVLLLIAGHETTVNLIANASLALLRSPAEWSALAADPTRAAGVAEETLRYDPPVHLVARVATEDLTVGDTTVEAGGFALLLIAAAGRDEAVFSDPDRFDPTRADQRSLAFGMGAHFCLGAPLARLEARLALARLTQRVRGAALVTDTPPYKTNMSLRGLLELPVTVEDVAPQTLPWPAL